MIYENNYKSLLAQIINNGNYRQDINERLDHCVEKICEAHAGIHNKQTIQIHDGKL